MSKANPSSLDGMIERMEREAFEKWAIESHWWSRKSLRREEDGYRSLRIDHQWCAWKGRASLSNTPLTSEREVFEAWAVKEWGGWPATTMRVSGGSYRDGNVNDSWVAWQARAALDNHEGNKA